MERSKLKGMAQSAAYMAIALGIILFFAFQDVVGCLIPG